MALRWLARAAFLLSGIAGLTFEIVWIRALGLSLGATTLAIATTTAAYMGGLALGSHLGGRLADRLRRPLALYGGLEIGLGLVGLAIPAICAWLPQVDGWLLDAHSTGMQRSIFRFVAVTLVLIIPTTAMGMTLPLLARAVTERLDEVGRQVGSLYAINILGALIGAACSGFWWIPTLGLVRTNMVAVGIDVSLGIVAVIAGLLFAPLHASTSKEHAHEPILRPGSRHLVIMLGVTGAAAMALQVLWSRALGTALGPSTYAFTAIVCAYLAGLGLGSAAAAWISSRLRDIRSALAAVMLFTGVAALIGISLVDDLPALLRWIVLDESLTMGGLLRTEFGLAALSVFPATFGMGAIFPLTLSAVVGSEHRVGSAVGRAYAVNTMGAIFGSFAGAFLLLPAFGVEWGMRFSALIYIVVAVLLVAKPSQIFNTTPRTFILGGSALAMLAGLLAPGWHIGMWTSGLFRLSTARSYYAGEDIDFSPIIFHRDGLVSTVTVEEEEGVRWIKVDGKIDGSSEGDMPTQVLSGLLPMLLHPKPKDVVVIGCGSCVTIGAVLKSGTERATLVELEPAVLEAARYFEKVNYGPWNDARLTIVEDDGRNFLRRTRGQPFDIIISEPSNPWMTGAASLFTQEFFKIAEERLAPTGLFLQWLQIYELAPERIASVLRTFQSVFPHVLVFSAHVNSNDLLMVGTREELKIDWSNYLERASHKDLMELLTQAELQNPAELFSRLLFDDNTIRNDVPEALLNTDDNALIEFGAPKDLLAYAEADPELPFLDDLAGARAHLVFDLVPTTHPQWGTIILDVTEGYLTQGMLQDGMAAVDGLMSHQSLLNANQLDRLAELQRLLELFLQPDTERIVRADLVESDPTYAKATQLLINDQDQGVAAALAMFAQEAELQRRTSAHSVLYAYLKYRQRNYKEADKAFEYVAKVDDEQRYRAVIAYYQARNDLNWGVYDRAVERMREYRQFVTGSLSQDSKEE